jgi:hypothetical protein
MKIFSKFFSEGNNVQLTYLIFYANISQKPQNYKRINTFKAVLHRNTRRVC